MEAHASWDADDHILKLVIIHRKGEDVFPWWNNEFKWNFLLSPFVQIPWQLNHSPSPLSSSLKWSLQSDETWSWRYLVGYYAAGPQVSEAGAPLLSHILSPPTGLFWFEYHEFLILLINLSHLNFIFRYLYQEIICMTSKLLNIWETFSCFLSTSKAIWSLNLEGWRLIFTGFWVPVSQRSRRPLFSLLWPLLQDIQAFPVLCSYSKCLPVTTFWSQVWGFVWGEDLGEASLTSLPLPPRRTKAFFFL